MEGFEDVCQVRGEGEGEVLTNFGNRSHIVGRASQRRLLRKCCGSMALAMINGVSTKSLVLESVERNGNADFF